MGSFQSSFGDKLTALCLLTSVHTATSLLSLHGISIYTFLGNCPPTPPLSQHFALSQRKPEGFKFPCGIRDPGHWNPGLGSKNPESANDWNLESSNWNREPTAWNPESWTLLDYHREKWPLFSGHLLTVGESF